MEESYYKSRIQIQAGAVLLLIDDFTNRPADETMFRVASRHAVRVIKKQGGVLALVNTPAKSYELTIESPYYQSKTVSIQPTGVCEIRKLRMIPGRDYPISMGRTYVTGYAQPGSVVYLACDSGERFLHLKEDYNPSDGVKLKLYCREPAELTGKQICMWGDGKAERCCLAMGPEDDGSCQLERPLSASYSKVGARALLVFEGQADETGWYRIPVKGPVKRLFGWNQQQDGRERFQEYENSRQDSRIDFSFL